MKINKAYKVELKPVEKA